MDINLICKELKALVEDRDALRRRVNDLETEEAVKSLTMERDKLKKEVARLSEQVDTVNERNAELSGQVEELEEIAGEKEENDEHVYDDLEIVLKDVHKELKFDINCGKKIFETVHELLLKHKML